MPLDHGNAPADLGQSPDQLERVVEGPAKGVDDLPPGPDISSATDKQYETPLIGTYQEPIIGDFPQS
jgi:hypothetical protein